jgi:DNA repair photolyase
MEKFNGKVIRHPNGKAGEYSYIAADAYFGCSNGCTYCYLKKGFLGRIFTEIPHLKAGIKDDTHALKIFEKELVKILPEAQQHGIFLNFESDPFLLETIGFTQKAVSICAYNLVPVKLLSKTVPLFLLNKIASWRHPNLALGFTLTGHDELEPHASPNAERIEAMRKLHDAGFKTWASIEPIIDFESSLNMILRTKDFCDLYKIGLESRKKYDVLETRGFMLACYSVNNKIYFKDSLLKAAGIDRSELPGNCVGRDYNIFKNK